MISSIEYFLVYNNFSIKITFKNDYFIKFKFY